MCLAATCYDLHRNVMLNQRTLKCSQSILPYTFSLFFTVLSLLPFPQAPPKHIFLLSHSFAFVCFVVESGPARVLLHVCGLEERVPQMLPQCRPCQRSHSALHAGLYPAYAFGFTLLCVFHHLSITNANSILEYQMTFEFFFHQHFYHFFFFTFIYFTVFAFTSSFQKQHFSCFGRNMCLDTVARCMYSSSGGAGGRTEGGEEHGSVNAAPPGWALQWVMQCSGMICTVYILRKHVCNMYMYM